MRRRALFFLTLLFFTSCHYTSVSDTNSNGTAVLTGEEIPVDIGVSSIKLPPKLEISAAPQDVALRKKIDEIIDGSEFANARWGVIALSLKDGRVLAARDAQKLFIPASTLKLFTTAAALDRLGPDFRWKTSVFARQPIDTDGRINSDLVLYGRGAPDLSREQLAQLADTLAKKGLKRVEGNIVGDDSFFRGDGMGDGWLWQDAQWYYGAQASALTFRGNQVEFEYSADEAKSDDDTITIDNNTTLAENGRLDAAGVSRYPGSDRVYVWGETHPGPQHVRIAAPDPKMSAARELKKELEKRGVVVAGNAVTADWRSREKLDETTATELASLESKTVAEVVRLTNKNSVNLYAELLLRTLGKNFGTEAPDDDKRMNAVRSDDRAGVSVVKKWLAGHGIIQGESVIHDGSGLSRLNYVSPELMARLLVAAQQMPAGQAFKDSLSAVGVDGTAGGRLRNFTGRILAKTGSITYVNSLAGYIKNENEDLVFVVFCNDQTRKTDVTAVIDNVAAAMAELK